MRKLTIRVSALVLSVVIFGERAYAQLSISAQVRARSEFRDGQGAPLSKGVSPAAFISQRTRLNALFSSYRIKLGIAVQDVRVWGQDVSTINKLSVMENNGLMLHQAWAELLLSDTSDKHTSLALKLGRQELVYDDQRLIGNLDWLQQARRHEAAVLKYEHDQWSVHVGAAYNQNREGASGTIYNSTSPGYAASTNGGMMYKSMQYLYAGKKLKNGNTSFLFFADQFSKYRMETIDNVPAKNYTRGSWTRVTTGVYFTNNFNGLDINGSAYYQFGKNSAGQNTRAGMLTLGTLYSSGKFSAGPGVDFTTGGSKENTNNAFDPLYGTPHKFWGTMDYFYAGSSFGKGGLTDYYLKLKWKSTEKLTFTADFHHFVSATRIDHGLPGNKRKLGQELDLFAGYVISKSIGIEGGYAHFFSTSLLTSSAVKNVANANAGANWAYLMINIRPEFIFK